MERRTFIGSSVMAMVASSSLAQGKEKVNSSETLKSGLILHSVYFWLRKGLSEAEKKDFLNYFEVLRKIPQVKSLHYGVPAKTEKRDVVDHSYSYNLLLTFESLADIGIYGNHPEHIKGAKAYEKYWERVEVKDTFLL